MIHFHYRTPGVFTQFHFHTIGPFTHFIIKPQDSSLAFISTESIEWFTKDQALLRSYDSAPRPPLFPPSSLSKLSLFLSPPVCLRSSLPTGERGEGVGEEPNQTTTRKPGPLQIIQSSLLQPLSYSFTYFFNIVTSWPICFLVLTHLSLYSTHCSSFQFWFHSLGSIFIYKFKLPCWSSGQFIPGLPRKAELKGRQHSILSLNFSSLSNAIVSLFYTSRFSGKFMNKLFWKFGPCI